jgi:integrase
MASAKTTESVNFYLKHGKNYANHNIFLQFKFDGKRLRYYLQQPIEKNRWNEKKQRAKDTGAKTTDGKHRINDLLNTLEQVCIDAYYSELANGTPTPAGIKKHLDAFMNQNHNAEKLEAEQEKQKEDSKMELIRLIERFEAGTVDGVRKSDGTIKNYRVTKAHLLKFVEDTGQSLDYNSINLDFYGRFVKYLQDVKGLSTNSTGNMIKNIRLFMGGAVDLGLTTNTHWQNKKFKVLREKTDGIYLTETDLTKLYAFDFSHNPRLESVRDMFVFGAWTGLRVSDFKSIKPENIREIGNETFISKLTKKTKTVVYIHCNPVVMEIFEKYKNNSNRLPKGISDQRRNDYIKEACRLAGLTDRGRLVSDPDAELCDLVTNHTSRRSFCTNYYLQGFPIYELMKISGHATEKAFMSYIKTTSFDAAKLMAIHNKKKDWTTLLGGLADSPREAIVKAM